MAKAISVILNLRDGASKGLLKVANNTQGVTKEMKGATRTVISWKNSAVKSLNAMKTSAVSWATSTISSIGGVMAKMAKWSAAAVAAGAAVAAKTGLSEAIDLEGYRTQLETATKDTTKAADIMTYAINLANSTPFEGGQMVEAASKFEAMGMSAKTWLTLSGDMAAATNKDFDQATEALIDAQTGELERMKEFGITKAMILQKGEEMFSGVQIANEKGQITDQEKFNDAMVALMQDKFSGGMEKQSHTLKGVYSTITGVCKSGLAKIVGMNEDGSVRAGSAFDIIREKAVTLAERLQQWQSDGTIDAIADKFAAFSQTAGGAISQVFGWISEHSDSINGILGYLGDSFGALANAAAPVATAIGQGLVQAFDWLSQHSEGARSVLDFIIGVLTSLLNAAIPVATLIGQKLVQAFDWLSQHSTGVQTALIILGSIFAAFKIVSFVGAIAGAISTLVTFASAIAAAGGIMALVNLQFILIVAAVAAVIAIGVLLYKNWDTICVYAGKLKDAVLDRFSKIGNGITGAFDNMKSAVKGVFDWFKSKFDWITEKLSWIKGAAEKLPGVSTVLSAIGIGENASGTPYWRGGLTSINERGGEIVDLPSGTRIIPHDVSKKQAGGSSVVVNLTIQGNVIGNREYMEQTGAYIAGKIMDAMDIA